MRHRIGFVALFSILAAAALQGQNNMFKIDLVPSGSMISLNEPTLNGGAYLFRAWPDGASTSLQKASVRKLTRLTGGVQTTVYKVELKPSGVMIAKANPTLKGDTYVFHTWRDGTYVSVRPDDIRTITRLTGDRAFWAKEGQKGEVQIGELPMKGGTVIEIANLPMQGGSQAGPTNASAIGRGRVAAVNTSSSIGGAPVTGNWTYQGTPGTSDAYGPANATVSSPGGVPTLPAATDGSSPPH
jgi:hypothetical protein